MWPAAMDEPEPGKRFEGAIAPEPESDQVHEPATPRIAEGVLVKLKYSEESPVPHSHRSVLV